jgi:hypothetical protein
MPARGGERAPAAICGQAIAMGFDFGATRQRACTVRADYCLGHTAACPGFVPRVIERGRVSNGQATELASEMPSNAPAQTPAARTPAATAINPPKAATGPPTADGLFRRGKERRAQHDYLAAICDFDEVLRAKPQFAWCFYERAGRPLRRPGCVAGWLTISAENTQKRSTI